ncbi:TIGR03086 family metal-binding protein [Isoptericola sp. BMS4]|uniref:TIGR03086 family metal-binding protein n=1 Tax=Isoptericola sp. BMS4 TaxID=2527875 RepID=UPI00142178DA|nr:TIGR03086 family metal-binding protein [Isoptericola sp. BMS4]
MTAQRWVTDLLDGTRPEQAADPTPCTEYDVRALAEHLHAVSAKLRAMAEGDNPRDLPARVPLGDEAVADRYAAGAAEAMAAWSDDKLLTTTVTAPFGPAPGALALAGFVMETVAHGWDLATATGQPVEAEPAVVAVAQAVAERALGDGPRDPRLPFDDPVEPPAGAGPTARLAAYLGRPAG